jgi:hypothetical protein
MRYLFAVFLSGVVAVATAACNGDSPASPSQTPSGSLPASGSPIPANNGRLFVRLSAGTLPQGKAVLVTFSRVRVYRGSPTAFTDLPLSLGGTYTCDLNKLTSDAELAVGNVPAAGYSQIGLVMQSATVYIDNPSGGAPCATSIPAPGGRAAPLTVPGGEIALPRNFDVRVGAETVMRLNFNTEQSIRPAAGDTFTLTPVFSVVGVS